LKRFCTNIHEYKTGGFMAEELIQRDRTTATSHNGKPEHREGPVARNIEEQTAKLPSDVYLWASVGCMATAAILQIARQKHASLFFGQWVAPILIMGLYNKIVKTHGHD
jgi:hypothetical protein